MIAPLLAVGAGSPAGWALALAALAQLLSVALACVIAAADADGGKP